MAPSVEASLRGMKVSRDQRGKVDVHVLYGMIRGGEKRRFLGGAVVSSDTYAS